MVAQDGRGGWLRVSGWGLVAGVPSPRPSARMQTFAQLPIRPNIMSKQQRIYTYEAPPLDSRFHGNDERGSGNDERGSGNDERGSGNDERGSGNDGGGSGNDERGSGNDERGSGNDERGSGNDGYAKVSIKGEEANRGPWEGYAKVYRMGEGVRGGRGGK